MAKNQNSLKVNVYAILTKCVDDGLELGWNRAHKHTDTPDKDCILQNMYDGVMLEISEFFKFDDYDD